MLRSLSESIVACVTGDFAMQNVILQIGLRLVAPRGMQIRELHRWLLDHHHSSHTIPRHVSVTLAFYSIPRFHLTPPHSTLFHTICFNKKKLTYPSLSSSPRGTTIPSPPHRPPLRD